MFRFFRIAIKRLFRFFASRRTSKIIKNIFLISFSINIILALNFISSITFSFNNELILNIGGILFSIALFSMLFSFIKNSVNLSFKIIGVFLICLLAFSEYYNIKYEFNNGFLIKSKSSNFESSSSGINISNSVDNLFVFPNYKNENDEYILKSKFLGNIGSFDSGLADKNEAVRDGIIRMCSLINKNDIVFLFGSTDRERLSQKKKYKFDSNVGLAKARANLIKKSLVDCKLEKDNIYEMISGPLFTPDVENKFLKEEMSLDRSVQVWVIRLDKNKPKKEIF